MHCRPAIDEYWVHGIEFIEIIAKNLMAVSGVIFSRIKILFGMFSSGGLEP
jgi:hypothetical protein